MIDENDEASPTQPAPAPKPPKKKRRAKKRPSTKKKRSAKKKGSAMGTSGRTRTARPYPASSFEEALPLAEAIQSYASGERVRRLTLLKEMDRSPSSSTTKMMITNSGKYGITQGSYAAEWISLTEQGRLATDTSLTERERLAARFKLAVEDIPPFNRLYEEYKGKKLPSHDVMRDVLQESDLEIGNLTECVDTFVVNAKYLGLLQTVAGSEMLIPIEQVLDEIAETFSEEKPTDTRLEESPAKLRSKVAWSKICFYITPIGPEGSEVRQHSDLFLSSLIEPALRDLGLSVVRADQIGEAGMITSQVLEHVMRARLAIVDLSWQNPNAFYEMAIRHACKLPVIQIVRKADPIPFDVNQVRTIMIDTSDIYSLVPRLETYRSEIANQARAALADPQSTANPLTVFFPGFEVSIPK